MTALAPAVGGLGKASSRPYARYRDSGVEWLGDVPEHWDVRRLSVPFADLPTATPCRRRVATTVTLLYSDQMALWTCIAKQTLALR